MKIIFTLFISFSAICCFGQKQIDSLSICSNKFIVPAGCFAESEYQVKCDNYSMVWLYMNDQMLEFMPDQFVNQLEEKMKNFKKEPVSCYLLGQEVKGYKISFKGDKGKVYQLIGYGKVNNQPVLVQLSLNNEIKSNEDIPDFPRQIIRLTK